jgi:capsular exopolysaccharide synthesis family protein
MDIWRAIEVLNRRKWLILFSVVAATVLTFGATRLMGSRFEATVQLISPQTAARASSIGSTEQRNDRMEDSPATQKMLQSMYTSILLSREVIEPAFKKLKEPLPQGTSLRDISFDVVGPRMYELHVTSSKPDKAEMLANAVAASFVQRNHGLYTQEAEKVLKLLQAQLRIADADLAKARRKYQAYSSQHKVIGTSEDEAKNALTEIEAARARRNAVQEELAAATVLARDTERHLAELAPALGGPRPVLAGPHANALSGELDRIESRLATLEARYGNNYPEVKESIAARNTLKARLQAAATAEAAIAEYDRKSAERVALQKTLADVKTKVGALQAQTAALDASISSAEIRALQARELNDPLGSTIASEVAARVDARASLANRLHAAEMAVDAAQRQDPIIVLAEANDLNPAQNVTAGRTKKLLVMAVLASLLGSCGIIIGLDSLDRRLKTVGEAEKLLPARILAAIPQPETVLPYSALARVAQLNPRSLPSEAYRFLGLHLLSGAASQVRSLMVVSAKAEQGSTTTVSNLAITLAQAGHRVVLVDANMRTPELHKVFETQNEFGFTDLLMDPTASSFERALLPTDVDNLRIITTGSAPENPWELFRSENLQAVSRRLRDTADYVLYDTPSGVLFTDALNLAPIVDGAFLCIRALETPTGEEQRLIDLISQSNVRMLGAVLSDVPLSMIAGYENYQHYYAPAALPSLPAPSPSTSARLNASESVNRFGPGLMGVAPGGGSGIDEEGM